jgi:dTDP-4-dehydrorhamnose reductase
VNGPLRVLVTGAGGLLGGRLAALLHERGLDVTAAHRQALPPPGPRAVAAELDGAPSVEALLDETRPEAVVHAAVLSRADDCENRPDAADLVNARLPGLVARACGERGIRLVALSTDLVFSGDRSFSSERDATVPGNVYGRSKLAGERAVLEACPAAAVARVALVLGRGHGSRATSSESIAQALRAGRPQKLFTDEFRTPIDPESVADALARLLAGSQAGVFHLGGPERLSRFELGERVARAFGLPTRGLVPALQAEHQGPDRRAPDASLDSGRARRELGWQPRPLDAAIREGRL